jgi:glycosyltransferase involved in cell wall biosynthesis
VRVARLIERLPPARGGKEIHAVELSRALCGLGVEQHVFARTGEPVGAPVATTLLGGGVASRLHPLAAWCGASARAVERQHRRTPFDLIHAHGDFLEASAAAVIAARLGLPAVLTVHAALSQRESHGLARLASFSAMEAVIAVSEPIRAQVLALGVASEILVRPSGVRSELFEVHPNGGGPPTIVTVGRLDPMKGLEHLIAAHDLLADMPELRFVVAAGGNGSYGTAIREQIAQRPRMRLIEFAAVADLCRLLAGATAFVLPSVDMPATSEGTPTALMEAIAARVPVVATDTGGTAALLAGGRYGLLVPPGDAAALAAAVRRVLAARAAARATAAAARAAEIAAPWPLVAHEVRNCYQRAVARHRRRGLMFAVPLLEIGGAERFAITQANGAAGHGLRVALAASPGPLAAAVDDRVELVPLARRGDRRAVLRNVLSLAGTYARTRPVAVDSHHLPTGLQARLAGLVSRSHARYALTVHVTENPRLEPIVGLLGALCFERVLPVAEEGRVKLSRAAPPWRAGCFHVVHAGVSPPQAVERRPETVGVVARLVSRKGHSVLFEAWRAVQQSPAAAGWTLELWGDGPERPALEAAAARLDNVIVRGDVPNAAGRVGELELLVLPSLREGLPLVLLEAMAAGTPVITSELPGTRELVLPGCGVLVPPGDAAALAAALLALIADPERRAELAANALRLVVEHYREADMVTHTLAELGVE